MNSEVLLLSDTRPPLVENSPAKNGAPEPAPSLQKANILVVDDREDKLLAMEAILSSLGQNLVKARSGKEALRQLLNQEFAVILMDVSMPTMDGFETAAMIRKRPRTEKTPIIFITSINTSENHVARGYELGAVDYMLTPIVPDILRAKVSVLIDLHNQAELIRQQGERLRQMEQTRHERAMAEATDRLEAETRRNRFFTLALDLLAIAGFDDFFIQLNPVWENTLGFSANDLKSKSLLEFVHPEDRTATAEQLTRIKLGTAPARFENRYLCSDGSFRWLSWTAAPFASEQLVYIFARDITARKAAENEIKKLNGELECRVRELTDANNELEAFNYSISHDLRAPLRSIRSFSQFLREDPDVKLGESATDYLLRIERAAKYMDVLLLDLLQYSRLSRAEIQLTPVDLESAVDDVVTSIAPEVHERTAKINIRRPLGTVMAHSATMRQIVYNLISNALKFVEPDQAPKIDIYSEPAGEYIRVWFVDEGIGIPPQFHKRIFGLFQRLHSAEAFPGTGVGLALVRRGLERMEGHIGLESEEGQGSRFWFELKTAHEGEKSV